MSDPDTDEDNVIRYGTPLEPYEEDEVPAKRKFQQQADQYAVDAQGRRRFHGAFTGGFSAGYGNTVGTPEGWAPTSFKSSRSEKAPVTNQKPEDFMDDEDRDEFGIAPRQLQTKNEFSGQKRQRYTQYHDGPIPGEPVLQQLIRPVHETAAVKMLRAMGWREGQGTGERLSKGEKRRAKDQHRVYGCYMPPEMRSDNNTNPTSDCDEDSTDSEIDYDTLFAPDDYEPYILQRKNDRFGLGYCGLSRHSVLGNLVGEYDGDAGTSKSHLLMKEKGRKVSIRGQAFGVGAFEAEDDDIYAAEDMSHYDFALGGAANDKKTKKPSEKTSNVLQGFVKSSKPIPTVPSYPPPALPRDYIPAAAGSRRSRFEPTTQTPRDQGLGRHELTAEARGVLLGESLVPETIIIPKDTPVESDPITKVAGRNVNFVSTSERAEAKELDFIPIKDSGKELSKVFKPFSSDPKKQTRYESYLKDKDSVALERDGNIDKLSEWERNRELVEFEQAAKLYKPLSGVMEERFTHAAEPDDGALNPLCVVARSTNNYGLATPEQIEAAKLGAYGHLTRRETAWRPESLVCKRFNVPEPGTTRDEPKKDEKSKVSYSIFSYLESSLHDKESFTKEQTKFSGSKSLNVDVAAKAKAIQPPTIKMKEDDKIETTVQTYPIISGVNKRITVAELFLKESEKDLKNKDKGAEVTETINKFDKMDLYKSIFLSDSENEDVNVEEPKTNDHNDFIEKPKNIERNTSPPRGIFANVDFDELNSWKKNAEVRNTEAKTSTETDSTSQLETMDKKDKHEKEIDKPETSDGVGANVYGPKIPENLKKRLEDIAPVDNFKPTYISKQKREVQEIDSSSESDSWIEANEVKSKKLKKKKSKQKTKKHKTKHKKSKHKKKDR